MFILDVYLGDVDPRVRDAQQTSHQAVAKEEGAQHFAQEASGEQRN